MKVLIAGANGQTGRLIVEELTNHPKHEAYAMIRHSEQEEKLKSLGAKETLVADLEGDLSRVLEGMDAVIFAAGSGSKTGPDKTIAVDQEGAKRLIDAAKEKGIQHFILLSSMGADHPKGPLEHYLKAKAEADRYLIDSGLNYTIVRPGSLSQEKATEHVELKKKIENRKDRQITRADVAKVLVASLDTEQTKNKVFEMLSGDTPIKEALESL